MGAQGGEECGTLPKKHVSFPSSAAASSLHASPRTQPPRAPALGCSPSPSAGVHTVGVQRVCDAHVWACSGGTGQRGCVGSSNAGAHLLLHPTALRQGGRVLPTGPCLMPKVLSLPSAVPVPAGGAGHGHTWVCPPTGAAAPHPSRIGRLCTPQCLLPGRDIGHPPPPHPRRGADITRARGRVRGLFLGPILFKARGTLHRLAGRTADEKQTAAHGASVGNREPGAGFEGRFPPRLPSPVFPHGNAGSLMMQGPSGRGSALGARGLPRPGQTLSPGKGCCIQSPRACFGGEIWCQCLLEWLWGVTPAPF